MPESSSPTDTPTPTDPSRTADAVSAADPHADKYNDPRVKFGWQGWVGMIAIFVIGAIVAVGSIYARRTRLGETTRFFGPATIMAIQLGDHVMLKPLHGSNFEPVELTAFPGLGHLRKALLDERHYRWESETEASVQDFCKGREKVRCVRLEFSDPTLKRFETARVDLELIHGVVGPAGQARRVLVKDRVRPALNHQIGLLMRVSEHQYDERE